MAINNASTRNLMPMVGFSYYFYCKACYFAGLYRRAIIPLFKK